MGRAQVIFAVDPCGGFTGSNVTGNDVTGSHVTGNHVPKIGPERE
jgi:hypothetical protein